MAKTRAPRYTIGQLMVWIAVLAALFAVPQIVDSPDRWILFCAIGVLTAFLLINVLIEAVIGKACPACSRGRLRHLVKHRRYYRCTSCHARFKRFGFGPWLDASGPEDEARYRANGAGNWEGFAAPRILDDSTGGLLLRSKRSRDLPAEAKQRTGQPTARRRSEEAGKKVRKFVERWRRKPVDETDEEETTRPFASDA
jgi:hypothetical protein